LGRARRAEPEARPAPPPDLPRVEYSYRIYWTKLARDWDGDRRQAVEQALAQVLAGPDFEPNEYERRYSVPGLDDQAHAGQSLLALRRVLRGLAEAGPDAAAEQ
jgi:hypothetical protein